MNINIQEYEAKIQQYNANIATEKQAIAVAEKDIIVAQTQLENYKQQMAQLESECQTLFGRPISEIDNIIEEKTKELEELSNNFFQAKSVVDNLNVMTEENLKDSMQFMTEIDDQF